MDFEIINKQVNNFVMALDQVLTDGFDVHCTITLLCKNERNQVIGRLDIRKDNKFSNTEFEIPISRDYDFAFYDRLLSVISERYMTHDEIFITDITKKVKGMVAQFINDFDYIFKIGHVGSHNEITIYIQPYSNLEEFEKIVVNYNEHLSSFATKKK